MKNEPANWKNEIKKSDPVLNRAQPKATEAEQVILGACMLTKDGYDRAAKILVPAHFHLKPHELIFRAFQNLSARMQPIDMVTTAEELTRMNALEKIGGPIKLVQLTHAVVSSANMESWCEIVYEKWVRRSLIDTCLITAGMAYEDSEDPFDLIDKVAAETSALAITGNTSQTLEEITFGEVERIKSLRLRTDELTGVPTGFLPLDRTTGGWQDTDLIILAARPSVGKTAFALNLARNAAAHPSKPTPVGIFSLEMSSAQLVRRIVAADGGISLSKLNKPKEIEESELEAVETAFANVNRLRLQIDDTPGMSLQYAKAKAREWVRDHKIGLLIIDYIQLMSGDKKSGNREQEIGTISRGLKALAKELRIPVIALSQLNREVDKQGREPRLSDLRESGSIEQDADMVAFLSRTDYQQNQEDAGEYSNQANLDIKKHRNGPLDRLAFYTALEIQRWMTPMEWDTYQLNNSQALRIPLPGNWRPAADTGARLYIQDGAERKDRNDDDDFHHDPF